MKNLHVALIFVVAFVGTLTAEPMTYLYVRGDTNEGISRGLTVSYYGNAMDSNKSSVACEDWTYDGQVDYVYFHLTFTNNYIAGDSGGSNDYWTLAFGTHKIPTNISTGDYPNAQRAAFASPGRPGLDITADHYGNSTLTGSFHIIYADFDYSGPWPICRAFAAVFRQSADYGTGRFQWLRGTLLYNYDGDLRRPVISGVAFSNGIPYVGMQSLMPGLNVLVERTCDLNDNWASNGWFACTEDGTTFADTSTNTMGRAFYRVKTGRPQ